MITDVSKKRITFIFRINQENIGLLDPEDEGTTLVPKSVTITSQHGTTCSKTWVSMSTA
jgi:hypothetical protein